MNTSIKTFFLAAAAAAALGASASAQDRSIGASTSGSAAIDQLAARAGLTPAEAAGLSVNEIAALKFNRDTSGDDRQTVRIEQGTNGSSAQLAAHARVDEVAGLSLNGIAAHFFNRSTGQDDRQSVPAADYDAYVAATRQISGDVSLSPAARQLAANAGLSEEEASDLTLQQIAAHFFNKGASQDDRQTTE
jgi:hypothetical protein